MSRDFIHRQSAHCESGVTANLLSHHGLEISEAMVFGIGAGLFFGYLPFIRVNYLPLVTFRIAPGAIFRKVTRRLGIQVSQRTFRDPEKGMNELDFALAQGTPVGLQTGVFWLPYFPPALRFHFNAHNLVAYGRQEEGYRISDPVLDEPVFCSAQDLRRARFAEGALAPKGRMYHLSQVPASVDWTSAIRSGIREVARRMVKTPVPVIGVRGIRYLSRQLEKWPARLGERRAGQYLGHLIRMQEEIGTGGGGFRFIYGAFLQEAADHLGSKNLLESSRRFSEVGDRWREFALLAARRCKGREDAESSYARLAEILRDCADREKKIFSDVLRQV